MVAKDGFHAEGRTTRRTRLANRAGGIARQTTLQRIHHNNSMVRKALLFTALSGCFVAQAQNATISRFKFWTADTAYSIWSDTSTVVTFKTADGSTTTVPTTDTIYTYTVEQLNKRLDIRLENLNVDGTAGDDGKERITGFPDRKVKAVLADGKFGMVVEVEVTVFAVLRKSENPRKKTPDRSIEMKVTVETYDGAGNRTAKYMERTRAADLKRPAGWQPGYDEKIGLTGNQVMALYTEALENALNTKR